MSQTAATLQLGCKCHWKCEPNPPPTTPIRTFLLGWAAMVPAIERAAAEVAAPRNNSLRLNSGTLFICTYLLFEISIFRQRHVLPTLGAETYVALDKLPDHELLAREQLWLPAQLLAHQRGCAAVIYDGRERSSQLARKVSDKPCRARLVLLVNPQEAIAQDQHRRMRVILIELSRIPSDDLLAAHLLRRKLPLELRRLHHPHDIATAPHPHGLR